MAARLPPTARSVSSLSSPFDCRAFTGRQSQRQHHDYELGYGPLYASREHSWDDVLEGTDLGHCTSPAAKRRPERNNSRCSGFRQCEASGTTTGVTAWSRLMVSLASS